MAKHLRDAEIGRVDLLLLLDFSEEGTDKPLGNEQSLRVHFQHVVVRKLAFLISKLLAGQAKVNEQAVNLVKTKIVIIDRSNSH